MDTDQMKDAPQDTVRFDFEGPEEANDWMRVHMESLRACAHWAEHESGTVEDRSHALLEAGLRAARALGDKGLESWVRHLRGLALLDSGDLEGADQEFVASLMLAETHGDDRARAASLEARGVVAQRDRRDQEALDLFDLVEQVQDPKGRPRGTALLDLLRGRSLVTLGRFDHALERLDAAREVFAPSGGGAVDEVNLARVRLERGRALNGKRRGEEARDELELSLAGFEARGHTVQMARVREALAGVTQLAGEKNWMDHLLEAERLYREVGSEAEAERIRSFLPRGRS
ncbi:tetratricopeptide repeat protein [Nocardiopsis prasina]|uniref:tetratricopeptide repeat protein n=1 Tax=Nocardiopsis prasina TaxID=2015 RepID=UPI00034A0B37|nr:hypothetical protein [Nocardiopsis prasina]